MSTTFRCGFQYIQRKYSTFAPSPFCLEHSDLRIYHKSIQFRRLALKSPPLGPKWGRWAKKLGCASDPPVCSLLVWEDQMLTQVFSPTYHTWALVGGTSRPAGKTVFPLCRHVADMWVKYLQFWHNHKIIGLENIPLKGPQVFRM